MFKKILIANRGEIACRIMRTAKKMGIRCVAIYSEIDQHALHTQMADEAYCVGKAAASDSYLYIEKIIEIAKQCGAEAIHPGYGFLSENAEFAQACENAHILFIGPSVVAIRAMGSKSMAKNIMAQANVPTVPGYHGDDQKITTLHHAAQQIGYPVLIKASWGGGGKGMRIVRHDEEFEFALESAKREAKASFGNDSVLIEKYLENPRHVEIQVFGDTHGNYVHLFERDCSIQRRHQKIIEEAPAPFLPVVIREKMGMAAIAAAQAVHYIGAGTVEFLLAGNDEFYFMEMNTRLQVEHPVTEMITGQDLVEWQLNVACGEPLPLTQDKLQINGHAFELRICAEDPDNQFLPSTGTLNYVKWPMLSPHIRMDTGVIQGDMITPWYDPMIAKLIVWGNDREQALAFLQQAIQDVHILGVKTNIPFLRKLIDLPDYTQGAVNTSFIPQHEDTLLQLQETSDTVFLLATLYFILAKKQPSLTSIWETCDGWRMNSAYQWNISFHQHEKKITVIAIDFKHYYHCQINQSTVRLEGYLENDQLFAFIDGTMMKATVIAQGNRLNIMSGHIDTVVTLYDDSDVEKTLGEHKARLTSPMPGVVIAVLQKVGDNVEKGTPLLILEAMKMEHTIYAPARGTVKNIFFQRGEQVQEGVSLLEFEEDAI